MSFYVFRPGNERQPGMRDSRRATAFGQPAPGWRHLSLEESQPWREATRDSYVIKPYHERFGNLQDIWAPEGAGGGGADVVTAEIRRWIPYRQLFPNAAYRYLSFGTAAVLRSPEPLPALDLLPASMQWANPVDLGRFLPMPWLPTTYGRPRNLPSGAPLVPVFDQSRSDLAFFQPLAADPATALRVLTPHLLDQTAQAQVAWWSDRNTLFVWVHANMPRSARSVLADTAKQIHATLVGGRG